MSAVVGLVVVVVTGVVVGVVVFIVVGVAVTAVVIIIMDAKLPLRQPVDWQQFSEQLV